MRRSAIVAALALVLLAGCDQEPEQLPSGPADVDRCRAAATAVGALEAPTDFRELQVNAALIAATARTTPIEDDRLSAALGLLDDAATDLLAAARDGDRAAATRASRRATAAYEAIDDAAQGMETAECGRRSWGATGTAIPA